MNPKATLKSPKRKAFAIASRPVTALQPGSVARAAAAPRRWLIVIHLWTERPAVRTFITRNSGVSETARQGICAMVHPTAEFAMTHFLRSDKKPEGHKLEDLLMQL